MSTTLRDHPIRSVMLSVSLLVLLGEAFAWVTPSGDGCGLQTRRGFAAQRFNSVSCAIISPRTNNSKARLSSFVFIVVSVWCEKCHRPQYVRKELDFRGGTV